MIRTSILVVCCLFFTSKLLSQESNKTDTATLIFEKVEIEASFPGGEQAWRKFLEKNLNPSTPVDNGAPCGKYVVYVQFVVDKQGRVSDVKPLTREGYGMEVEVVRTMKKSGLWTPAIQLGRPVNAYRKQPITFLVEEDGFTIETKTPYTLYTDADNELTITLDNAKADDLEVAISQGTIVHKGGGIYNARVSKPGRVVITVINKKKKKKNSSAMSFEVRKREGGN